MSIYIYIYSYLNKTLKSQVIKGFPSKKLKF